MASNDSTSVDRISELPDSLLHHILSLMPTERAFRTRSLSKRWRYLWTSLYNIYFYLDCELYNEEYVSFVDYVLAHSVSPKIKELVLHFRDPSEYKFSLSRWLSFAVEKKVENVELWSFSDDDACALPESFYTCSSLITLVLGFIYFDDGVVISWKSLKSITFKCMALSNDDIVNLLLGCPALETMEFNFCEGFTRLEIRSSKLKRLKLINCRDDGSDQSLEMVAPYLQHLEISRIRDDFKCRLVDVSSVVNAKLTFNITCIKDIQDIHGEDDEEDSCRDYHQVFSILVQDYLQKLSCATDLTIASWFTEVLCMLRFKGVLIPELKCKYLTLELCIKKFNLYGAAGLLRAFPYVETLNIDMCNMHFYNSRCQFESRYLALGDNIDLQSWVTCFVFPNLKNVRIADSFWCCLANYFKHGDDKLFKLSEFLLKRATVLEKFIIISKTRKCKRCSMNCVSEYLNQLAGKLLGCPRSSTNSVIIFQE